jgi:hypothetical protein
MQTYEVLTARHMAAQGTKMSAKATESGRYLNQVRHVSMYYSEYEDGSPLTDSASIRVFLGVR